MTRENKLALVVGFGLILVVGILISDHLSAAHRQQAAHLGGVVDPLNTPNGIQPATRLVEYHSPNGFGAADNAHQPTQQRTGQPSSSAATLTSHTAAADHAAEYQPTFDPIADRSRLNRNGSNTASILTPGPGGYDIQLQSDRNTTNPAAASNTNAASDPRPAQNPSGLRTVTLDDLADMVGAERPSTPRAPAPAASSITFHHVQEGETLSTITRKFYGSSAVLELLAAANDIANPNLVQVGRRLNLPAMLGDTARIDAAPVRAASDRPTSSGTAATTSTPASSNDAQTYTIQPGDTLSELSQRFLGTSRRWKELQEYNAKAIPDPDRLRAGVVIRIPQR